MNPFDVKSVLLARHAQHVVLIHFPIALFIIAVAFDFVAQWKRQGALAAAAYYNMLKDRFKAEILVPKPSDPAPAVER